MKLVTPKNKDKTEAFLDEFWKITDSHPWNGKIRIFYNTLIELSSFSGEIHLSDIQAITPRQGNATEALKALKKLADKHGVVLSGWAKAYTNREGFINKDADLRKWYKKNGFKLGYDGEIRYEPKKKINEKLGADDDVVTWIRHFRASKNSRFKNDDRKQRWRRAVAAWMNAKDKAGKLDEALDKALPYKMTSPLPVWQFTTPSGLTYKVAATFPRAKTAFYSFNMVDSDGSSRNDKTGAAKEEAFSVFATVGKIIVDHVKEKNLTSVYFSGDKSEGRADVYKLMAKRLLKELGWKRLEAGDTNWSATFVLHKRGKTAVNEAIQLKQITKDTWQSPKGGFTVVKQNNGSFNVMRRGKVVSKGHKTIGGARRIVSTKLRALKEEVSDAFDLLKEFDENQPRVPAGREGGGQFTFKGKVPSWRKLATKLTKDYGKDKKVKEKTLRIRHDFDKIVEDMDKFVEFRDWYGRHVERAKRVFGEWEPTFERCLAAASANASGPQNFTNGVRATLHIMAGGSFETHEDFPGVLGEVRKNFKKIQEGDLPSGFKIQKFARALEGDWSVAPPDRWMRRMIFQWPSEGPNQAQSEVVQLVMDGIAEAVGWTTAEAQAVGWAAVMAEANLKSNKSTKVWDYDEYFAEQEAAIQASVDYIRANRKDIKESIDDDLDMYEKMVKANRDARVVLSVLKAIKNKFGNNPDPEKVKAWIKKNQTKISEEVITEGRDAPLFHATNGGAFEEIMKTNILQDRTYQAVEKLLKKPIPKRESKAPMDDHINRPSGNSLNGISLTRDFGFAINWTTAAIFELDQRKLAQRYQILPFHFFTEPKFSSSFKSIDYFNYGNNEFEEFVIGPVKDFRKYVKAVWIKIDRYYNNWERIYNIIKKCEEYNIPCYRAENKLSYLKKKIITEKNAYDLMTDTQKIDYHMNKALDKSEHGYLDNATKDKIINRIIAKSKAKVTESKELVSEGRDAPLYHATTIQQLISMTENDEVWGATTHQNTKLLKKMKKDPFDVSFGVSLTRSFDFAMEWGGSRGASYVVLEFDQRKLANRFEIIPIDYYQYKLQLKGVGRSEAEEFLVGGIPNMSKYLKTVYISKNVTLDKDLLQWFIEREIVVKTFSGSNIKTVRQTKPYAVKEALALDEARAAPLYHNTSSDRLLSIIEKGEILDLTTHGNSYLKANPKLSGYTGGISLTRSMEFARKWHHDIIIEFDQEKLIKNHKLIPVNYWEAPRNRYESEEFLVGKMKNFWKYIKQISIEVNPSSTFERGTSDILQNQEKVKEWAAEKAIPVKTWSRVRKRKLGEENLNEGRDAPLFHATREDFILRIMKSNTLEDRTTHAPKKLVKPTKNPDGFYAPSVTGISTTRDKKMAMEWGVVVFELDQRKLAHNHEIVPIDYWGTTGHYNSHRSESEEFIIGPVKNLKKYVTKIYLSHRIGINIGWSYKYWKLVVKKMLEWNVPIEGLEKIQAKFAYYEKLHGIPSPSKHDKEVGLEEEVITEGRDATLYHSTNLEALNNILKDNTIDGSTIHKKTKLGMAQYGPEIVSGVSLTRSKEFAHYWGTAVIELDQRKLDYTYQFRPIDYFANQPSKRGANDRLNPTEAEEFVVGSIIRANKYITGIWINLKKLSFESERLSSGVSTTMKELENLFALTKEMNIPITNRKEVNGFYMKLKLKAKKENHAQHRLMEARQAPLYHSTSVPSALSIIAMDALEARTSQRKYKLWKQKGSNKWDQTNDSLDDGYRFITGTSLTRSMKFAKDWSLNGVVFELDQMKLIHNHEIIPMNYWSGKHKMKGLAPNVAEFEEFLVGKLDKLHKYVTAIYFQSNVTEVYKKIQDYIQEKNPKIKLYYLSGDKWVLDNMSSRPQTIKPKYSVSEEAALNAGSGAIAGIGIGPDGEPPVPQKKKKKKKINEFPNPDEARNALAEK